ncbi:MAG: zinc-binding dehydrogenase [Chloroflexota bacterium]
MIPKTTKAVVLHDYTEDWASNITVEERPLPELKRGQVLLKMAAAPINPSDAMFIQGKYGFRKELPAVPGFEGAGEIIATGGGVLPYLGVGKRVACTSRTSGDGTWAEYMVTDGTQCFPVGANLSMEQAATAFVNPLTAVALVQIAKQRGAKAAVSTAAASQLGRMMLRIGIQRNFPIIHVVRRDEQVKLLRDLGGEHVLNSSDDDFDEQLHGLSKILRATMLFDAVAGELTGRVLTQMPSGSVAMVYGALSEAASPINPADLIFRDVRVEGFWLAAPNKQLNAGSLLRLFLDGRRIMNGNALTASEIHARYPLDDAVEAITAYLDNMTAGKVLIQPDAPA